MRLNSKILTVGALALALSAGGLSAEAGQREGGRDRGDRGGRNTQGDSRERSDGARSRQEARGPRGDDRGPRGDDRGARGDDRGPRAVQRAPQVRGDYRDHQRPVVVVRPQVRPGYAYRPGYGYAPGYRYSGPRRTYPHYYGSGGHLSVYFGLGSGYRYGSPYSGRVYGYARPGAYGARLYYGDVRLQMRPRGAAVYVDGYYAGIVDDFDGVFQRLTLEVGPHEIEIEAPGFEPQSYDVYVDPTRTVDLRGDLFPDRP